MRVAPVGGALIPGDPGNQRLLTFLITQHNYTYKAREERAVLEGCERAGDLVGEDEEEDGEEKDVRLVEGGVAASSEQLSSLFCAHPPGQALPVDGVVERGDVPAKVVAGS